MPNLLTSTPGINIKGGTGIGVVTKPGLQVPVGETAINPTPKMIISNLSKHLPEGMGADVVISVPEGKELAKKNS